eukprot:scpid107727/ scgid32111/ 
MDDRDWTSESSVDSDALSPLPPLVIWTSRRTTACPPPHNIPYYGTNYPALEHANPVSANQVVTSEGSFAYGALQNTSFSPWNTQTSSSAVLQDHAPMDTLADNSREPRPEIQMKKDIKPRDALTTAAENPCLDP